MSLDTHRRLPPELITSPEAGNGEIIPPELITSIQTINGEIYYTFVPPKIFKMSFILPDGSIIIKRMKPLSIIHPYIKEFSLQKKEVYVLDYPDYNFYTVRDYWRLCPMSIFGPIKSSGELKLKLIDNPIMEFLKNKMGI